MAEELKLYILHDNDAWMRAWRPILEKTFGPNGWEEWCPGADAMTRFDFNEPPPTGLFYCKGSGSAHARGLPHARAYFAALLNWLEFHGRPVINGQDAFELEVSKLQQLVAMHNFALEFPKATTVFGRADLLKAATKFAETVPRFWIRFNRAGCGRGVALCENVADVKAFLSTGSTSPDDIYILQEWVEARSVVRLELAFGELLYGVEITVDESTPSLCAPCGCPPSAQSTLQPLAQRNVSVPTLLALQTVTGAAAAAAVTNFSAIKDAVNFSAIKDAVKGKEGLLAVGAAGVLACVAASKLQSTGAVADRAQLLRASEVLQKHPSLRATVESAKLLMADANAGTLALDVVPATEGNSKVWVLDMNVHTTYNQQREKDAGLLPHETGVQTVVTELSRQLSALESPAPLAADTAVFGIGLPRTGTRSLAESLKMLGYRGEHVGIFGGPARYAQKGRMAAGTFSINTTSFKRFEELFRQYPDARFILTTRLDEDWAQAADSKAFKDMPSPNAYLADVLRFFVNQHATHRLLVCNIFTEDDTLLWSKLSSFLPSKPGCGLKDPKAWAFPRVSVRPDGRITKGTKEPRSPKSPSPLLSQSFELGLSGDASLRGTTDAGNETEFDTDSCTTDVTTAHKVLARYCNFESEYRARFVVRPDNEDACKATVVARSRFTPEKYDRHVFSMTFSTEHTPLADYEVGDCLGVYPQNAARQVGDFIRAMRFDADEVLELDTFFTGKTDGTYVMTVEQMFTEFLDLFGEPTRSFYLALSKHAEYIEDREALAELSLKRKSALFEARNAQAVTFASTILEFKSVKLTPTKLLELVPLTKPRLYSIASSQRAQPKEVELMMVTHNWDSTEGERLGLCTGYLEDLPVASSVVVALVRGPTLKLPKESATPVIMVGMGTGMAPFRGFVQERACDAAEGKPVGSMRLYFGARHQKTEFYYREELEESAANGWLLLRCAWSRDQRQKVYVQNLIEQDGQEIWDALKPETAGHFYLCGPVAPLACVEAALQTIFETYGAPHRYLDVLKAEKRFSTEVY